MSLSDHPRGRTTRDGNLPLAQKPERHERDPEPSGGASSPPRDEPSYGGGGYGGGHGSPMPALEPMATASLICGVVGLGMLCCCGMFTLLLSPAAIILGLVSLGRIRGNPQEYTGAGLAWAGIATGGLGLALILAYLAFAVVVQIFEMYQRY